MANPNLSAIFCSLTFSFSADSPNAPRSRLIRLDLCIAKRLLGRPPTNRPFTWTDVEQRSRADHTVQTRTRYHLSLLLIFFFLIICLTLHVWPYLSPRRIYPTKKASCFELVRMERFFLSPSHRVLFVPSKSSVANCKVTANRLSFFISFLSDTLNLRHGLSSLWPISFACIARFFFVFRFRFFFVFFFCFNSVRSLSIDVFRSNSSCCQNEKAFPNDNLACCNMSCLSLCGLITLSFQITVKFKLGTTTFAVWLADLTTKAKCERLCTCRKWVVFRTKVTWLFLDCLLWSRYGTHRTGSMDQLPPIASTATDHNHNQAKQGQQQ